MANVKVLLATDTLSTSTTNWNKCTQYNLGGQVSSNIYNFARDDVNTTRNAANFAMVSGRTYNGVFLTLNRSAAASGSWTVKLMEGSTERATSATLSINATDLPNTVSFIYVPFSTPYKATTTNNVNIRVNCDTAARLYWMRDATASNWTYAVADDSDSTKPGSGDTVLLKQGITLTVDENITMGVNGGPYSLLMGNASIFSAPNPSSAITIAFGTGSIAYSGNNSQFLIGSEGTPVTSKSGTAGVTLTTSTLVAPSYPYLAPVYYQAGVGAGDYSGFILKWYGAKCSTMYVTCAADTESTYTFTAVEAIPGTWTNGDAVYITGYDYRGQISTLYYMRNVSPYVVDLYDTAAHAIAGGATGRKNVSYKVWGNYGRLFNWTENLRTTGISSQLAFSGNLSYQFILSGVTVPTFGTPAFSGPSIANSLYPALGADCVLDSCIYGGGCSFSNSYHATTINNFHCLSSGYSSSAITLFNATITNSTWHGCCAASSGFTGTNITFTNVTLYGNSQGTGSSNLFPINGYGYSFNNCIFGNGCLLGVSASTFLNTQFSGANPYGIQVRNSVRNTFTTCKFGVSTSNLTYDIYFDTGYYSENYFNGGTLGSMLINNNAAALPGSYLEWHNYGNTVGDHRTWKANGTFTTDSPYTNLREETGTTTLTLSHQFPLLSQTIASKKHYLVATAQINNAAYYGGTHTSPTLNVYADLNTTTALSTLAFDTHDTSAHTSSIDFTPTTSNNPLQIDFLTQTDATGSNADVLWSNVKVVQRVYGYTYTSTSLLISETVTYPIATLTTPVSNSFITQPTQATVHAYTGIAYDGTTLTISSNHTRQEIYDWTQDYLSLNPTVASFFDTIDGINYTATCNITINTGVALTGGGTINVGTYTFTRTGTGSYDGIVITSTNRSVHVKLVGIVSGSQYFIQKQSDYSSVFNATCSGDTDDLYTYTTDLAVYVTVRKYGYVTIDRQSATITSTGLTLNIGQTTDGTV